MGEVAQWRREALVALRDKNRRDMFPIGFCALASKALGEPLEVEDATHPCPLDSPLRNFASDLINVSLPPMPRETAQRALDWASLLQLQEWHELTIKTLHGVGWSSAEGQSNAVKQLLSVLDGSDLCCYDTDPVYGPMLLLRGFPAFVSELKSREKFALRAEALVNEWREGVACAIPRLNPTGWEKDPKRQVNPCERALWSRCLRIEEYGITAHEVPVQLDHLPPFPAGNEQTAVERMRSIERWYLAWIWTTFELQSGSGMPLRASSGVGQYADRDIDALGTTEINEPNGLMSVAARSKQTFGDGGGAEPSHRLGADWLKALQQVGVSLAGEPITVFHCEHSPGLRELGELDDAPRCEAG
jgi:hypothetical protein